MRVNIENIPLELRRLNQWLVWRLVEKPDIPGDFDKKPFSPLTGKPANMIEACSTFETAHAAHEQGDYSGLGFRFSGNEGFVGIDFDACLDPDRTVRPWAISLLSLWAGYLEVSPSGSGLKGIGRGQMAKNSYSATIGAGGSHDSGGIEMYASGRYFTITGDVWSSSPSEIMNEQSAIDGCVTFIEECNGTRKTLTRADGESTYFGLDPADYAFEYDARGKLNHTTACCDKFLHDVAAKVQWFGSTLEMRRSILTQLNDTVCQGDVSPADIERILTSVEKYGGGGYTSAVVPVRGGDRMPELICFPGDKDRPGPPKPLLVNVERMLGGHPGMKGVLAKNAFKLTIEAIRETPWGYKGEWTDAQDSAATVWLQTLGLEVPSAMVREGVLLVSEIQSYHPVRDYLNGLTWDGMPRVSRFFADYFAAEDTPLVAAFGRKWLISAVARIFVPGCQADHTPAIESGQGKYKSSGLRALFGDEWFTDDISDLGTKDSKQELLGKWGFELAELDSMDRRSAETVKAFLTRRSDRFRPPYGHHPIEVQRQCVFCASTNRTDYLKDETGNRRIWPVRLLPGAMVNVDRIKADRDQLWAEAVTLYRAGEPCYIAADEATLLEQAQVAQADRADCDVWDDAVMDYVRQQCAGGQTAVTIDEILLYAIEKERAHWTPGDKARVWRILRQNDWEPGRHGKTRRRGWTAIGYLGDVVFRQPVPEVL